jgi:hypothetical protein
MITPPPYLDSPIYKLDGDLLWKIFTLNTTLDTYHKDPAAESASETICPSPLTNTRHCSQVCGFWRHIIINSPSIWASSIDLNALAQEKDDWRNEVLRRTQDALLTVKGRFEASSQAIVTEYPGLRTFFTNLIYDHWTRIQIIDVAVQYAELSSAKVLTAFGRSAPNLQVFAIQSIDAPTAALFPPNFRLFADEAPSLVHFSLGVCTLYLNYRPILHETR